MTRTNAENSGRKTKRIPVVRVPLFLGRGAFLEIGRGQPRTKDEKDPDGDDARVRVRYGFHLLSQTSISRSSSLGGGSSFMLWLPLLPSVPSMLFMRSLSSPELIGGFANLWSLHISGSNGRNGSDMSSMRFVVLRRECLEREATKGHEAHEGPRPTCQTRRDNRAVANRHPPRSGHSMQALPSRSSPTSRLRGPNSPRRCKTLYRTLESSPRATWGRFSCAERLCSFPLWALQSPHDPPG